MALFPAEHLEKIALPHNLTIDQPEFAQIMDSNDPLRSIRKKFAYPKFGMIPGIDRNYCNPDEESIYLCGNSLGLMPVNVPVYVNRELKKWSEVGVVGHLYGDLPWAKCDDLMEPASARLVGAETDEIAALNGLTVNLSLLLSAFYRPTKDRYKILMESQSFPSDHYLVASHTRFHGYDPFSAIVCVNPRQGEHCLRDEDILETIEQEGSSIALILFSGVQYYTGQVFDMKGITEAGHKKGCIVGFDLAHAIGNVKLKLKEWNVDFAAWCTYKYLNAGAGALGGLYFNKRWHDDVRSAHGKNPLLRFEGWWGHDFETRFHMSNKHALIPGAGGFKMSNTSPMVTAPLLASLEIFDAIDFEDLLRKQFLLTGYLEYLLKLKCKDHVQIITPSEVTRRGNQISVIFDHISVKNVKEELEKRGVLCDVREPHVLRVAPVPLYNSFRDVYLFVQALQDILTKYTSEKNHTHSATE